MSLLLHIQADNSSFYNQRKNHSDDSGFDLYCPNTICILPRSTTKIHLGVRCQMFSEEIKTGYFLLPRSSIVKTPLRLANSVGLIDRSYTGEIIAVVDNISDNEFIINKGDRYFQLVHPSLKPIVCEIVDKLEETDRGSGGFGSTGK